MGLPHRQPRPPLLTIPILVGQVAGIFVLPFFVGLVAALFLEVSEVAETLPALMVVTLCLLVPVALAQLAGLVMKSRTEIRWWRDKGGLTWRRTLDILATHAGVVTIRGWTLLLLGCTLTLVALWLQWASFGLLAVLGLLLFYVVVGWTLFVSTFLVRTFERGLGRADATIERRMDPAVVHAGDSVEEVFRFRRVPVPFGYRLLVEDPLHPRLRTESRYVVGARARSAEVTARGRLRATPRGYYEVGPAQLWYQDLLGITRVSVASVATAALKVLPRVRAATIIEPPRSASDQPDVLTRPHRFPTEDLFRFREYAAGDDTRRIHWRLSIKHGTLQVRVPETRETTTHDIVLALDSFIPARLRKHAEHGADGVLDSLVDAWIGLAVELVQRGDRVTLVAAVRQHDGGGIAVERIAGRRGELARWQDLGARVAWQSEFDVDALLEPAGDTVHGLVATARVLGPPPGRLPGADTSWIVVDPAAALGPDEPHWLRQLTRGGRWGAVAWVFRLPHPAGSEDNAWFRRIRAAVALARAWRARRSLRAEIRRQGGALASALGARGDAVYQVESGPTRLTFRGLFGQRGGVSEAA